jgi:hypothetical protein
MAAPYWIGRSSNRTSIGGQFLELDLIRKHFARQVVEEALATGKPLGNLLDESRVAAFGRTAH